MQGKLFPESYSTVLYFVYYATVSYFDQETVVPCSWTFRYFFSKTLPTFLPARSNSAIQWYEQSKIKCICDDSFAH